MDGDVLLSMVAWRMGILTLQVLKKRFTDAAPMVWSNGSGWK